MDRLVKMILSEKEEYLQRVKQEVGKHKGLVIYGAGFYGKNLAKLLLNHGIEPRTFCVSSLDSNRQKEWGIPIRSLKDLIEEGNDDVYLIAAEEPKNKAMIQALIEYGVSSYIDITPHFLQIVDQVYFRPIVEITSRVGCRVNCRYCPQNLFIKKYHSSDGVSVISLENFKKCVDKLPREVILDFAGFSEPFLNPDIVEMMEYALEKKHDMRLYTTLMGLSTRDLERVTKIPFLSVVLHLPDIKQCANISVTDEYLEMLEICLSTRKKNGQPFIDHASAQCEPPKYIMDRIKGKLLVSWDMIDRAGNVKSDEVRSSALKKRPLLCNMSAYQNHNILLPNGNLLLCCMDWGIEYVLGNLLSDSYENIMQGERIKEIRREMLAKNSRNVGFLCEKCTSAIEIG